MSSFSPRLVAPDVATNKYYRYPYSPSQGVYVTGGVNDCLLINPSNGAVMPNCVGYAWGRAYELLGSRPTLCQGDANLWWTYSDGYPRKSGTDRNAPKPGAIVCMRLASPGHVAIVENQTTPTEWTISESIYGGAFFRLGTIAWNSSDGRWWCWYDNGSGGSYNPWDVEGFIYPPYDWYNVGEFKFITQKQKKRIRRRVL